jgi:ketosteroid isomerase-like protein
MGISRRSFTTATIGALAVTGAANAAAATAESPAEFAHRFLTAFENLDMDRFIECFAADATVFFPLPEPPSRFDGKQAIREHFQGVFDAIRGGAKSGPPYHTLNAEDLRTQPLGADAAVVTFHLRNAQRTARRTLVLHRKGGWSIAHLHASNVLNSESGR